MKLIAWHFVNIQGTPQKVNSSNGPDQSLRYGMLLLWFQSHACLGRTINTGCLWSCHSQHRIFSGSPLPSKAHSSWWTHPPVTATWSHPTFPATIHSCEQTHQACCTWLITGFIGLQTTLLLPVPLVILCILSNPTWSLLFSEPWYNNPSLCTSE